MKRMIFFLIAGLLSFGSTAQDLKWENAEKKGEKTQTKKSAPKPVLSKPGYSAAPYAVKIREGKMSMSAGPNYGYSMNLPDISEKEVKSLWKNLMKDYGSKPKKVKKSDDMLASDIRISAISGSDLINVYSQTEKSGDGVAMTVWFDMGNGNFLSSQNYPNSYTDGEKFLQDFAVTVKKASVQNELDVEEKALKKLEKELKSLRKKKAGLEKDIENFKKKILQAEQNIVENEADQAETENSINEQIKQVEEVTHRLKSIH